MKELTDITNKRFNSLVALKHVKYGNWLCRCECGNTKVVAYHRLVNNITKSCGCISKNKFNNLTGKHFSHWTAIEYLGNRKWKCKCDCEFQTESIVSSYDLTHNKSKACLNCKGRAIKKIEQTPKDKLVIADTIIGSKFGEWEVLSKIDTNKVNCKCSCGIERAVLVRSLVDGKSSFCNKPSRHNIKMHNFVDITGKVYGNLTVINYLNNGYWLCECSCGNKKEVKGRYLRSGEVTSCGHLAGLEHIGKKYGELSIKERIDATFVLCECDCGNITIKRLHNILNGNTTSCGCKNLKTKKTKEDIVNTLNNLSTKPSLEELAIELDVSIETTRRYINNLQLWDRIDTQFSSRYEREIYKIIGGGKIHDRTLLEGTELDIYIPEKKLAIEFNGGYWHSEIYKDKYYHQDKTLECAKLGVHLIHIFEHEWKDSRLRNILINYLQGDKIKIGARKTYITEINTDECNEFLEKNHLQNKATSSIKLGCLLKDTNEIVGVMTLGKPRFNNKYEYEIIRLCWKSGYSIIGGIEKMFKHFVSKYNPKSIITYVDISKFTGNSYLKIGFKPVQPNPITEPNYVWIDNQSLNVLSRYQTQKHKLIAMGLGNIEQTEDEIMKSLDYIKIHNSGNLVLEYIR